jgi:glycosyltransferase involved in cell wall biosynthesis
VDYPKISIVTPCFNAVEYLEETIQSIISQRYPNLEYIIIDGGSTDGTLEIIKKYEQHLTFWISEKDEGLYFALNKGFKHATGEIMAWLNADDLLHQGSLNAVSQIFKEYNIEWLQGYPTLFNENSATVAHNTHVYSKYHFYLNNHLGGNFIQQESTFWRKSLWEKSGAKLETKFKYAADFELWMRFFKHANINCTNTLLGGYRVRKEQLSRVYFKEYLLECDKIINSETLNLRETKMIQMVKFLKRYSLLRKFCNLLIQKLYGNKNQINYDFKLNKFIKE